MFSRKGIRKIVIIVLLYAVAFIAFPLLEKTSPSGPCTPGLGIMEIFLLPFISGFLFIISSIKVSRGNKTSFVPAMIHLIVVIGFLILLLISKH